VRVDGLDGVLTSESTRLHGLVTEDDYAGGDFEIVDADDPVATVQQLDDRIDRNDRWRTPLTFLLAAAVIALGLVRPAWGLRALLVALAVNLWLSPLLALAAGLAAVALPLGLACAAVVAVYLASMGLDAETVALSPFGPSQVNRFYGINNLLETMLAAPALVGAALLGHAGVLVAALAFVTIGGNRFGADGGGIVVLAVARDPLLIEVPDVSGLTTARALARLRAAALRPRAQEVPSREPRGTVLRQLPAPGTEVPRGSPAIVVVASGPQLSTVPAVVGLPVGEATTRLTGAGFRSRVARVPSSQPEGTVVAQNPAGQARSMRGSVVRLNVSIGPGAGTTTVTTATTASATVPDTVGQDEATAVATIEGAGYAPQVIETPTTDSAQDGIVIRQAPKGGGRFPSGSTVTLFVGRLN
jgi:beta-lactam-binding protein with PASTA domain